MTNAILRRSILPGLIIVPLATNVADAGAGDSVKLKVEEFLGQAIETIVCEPIERKTGSPIDRESCEYFSRKSLESCWKEMTAWFPNLESPVDEYSSWLDPDTLDRLRETVYDCIQGGTFLSDEDRLRYWELQSGRRAIETEEKGLATSWMSAVESTVAQYGTDRDAILGFADAFLSSDYMAVHLPDGDLVIGTVENDGNPVSSRLETPPAWVASMRELGFTSINRFASSTRANGESPLVTDEHEFFFQLLFGQAADLPKCSARFETIDCGVCVAMASDDFDLLITWVSTSLVKKLMEESESDPAQESTQDENRNDGLLARCIEDGLEQARSLP